MSPGQSMGLYTMHHHTLSTFGVSFSNRWWMLVVNFSPPGLGTPREGPEAGKRGGQQPAAE